MLHFIAKLSNSALRESQGRVTFLSGSCQIVEAGWLVFPSLAEKEKEENWD